ncbi:MAG: hypothetical protein GYA51_01515 [Candidatus Methanofastidiosa archaeon]|nr:hypothetical protein [Candidatus Methanofastidiosa archaeon]
MFNRKPIISEEDLIIISNSVDPLTAATELGYTVDKDLIVELFIKGVQLEEERPTSMNFHLPIKELEVPNFGSIVRGKITELFGDDKYELIALSHKYQDPPHYLSRTPGYRARRACMPKYMKKIVHGCGLSKCTSLDEIRNFKLSDENG